MAVMQSGHRKVLVLRMAVQIERIAMVLSALRTQNTDRMDMCG